MTKTQVRQVLQCQLLFCAGILIVTLISDHQMIHCGLPSWEQRHKQTKFKFWELVMIRDVGELLVNLVFVSVAKKAVWISSKLKQTRGMQRMIQISYWNKVFWKTKRLNWTVVDRICVVYRPDESIKKNQCGRQREHPQWWHLPWNKNAWELQVTRTLWCFTFFLKSRAFSDRLIGITVWRHWDRERKAQQSQHCQKQLKRKRN